MSNAVTNATLTELGKRLVGGSLSDASLMRATANTPDFAILPWANVIKIGGQSIMDRGRVAVMPLIDEIVANLQRHKMILGTGAGTRARHIYSGWDGAAAFCGSITAPWSIRCGTRRRWPSYAWTSPS